MKYYEDDTNHTVKNRLRRCIKRAKRGQWKKADAALGDGVIIDLNINDNWNKTKSKFVSIQPIKRIFPEPKSQWNLDAESIHKILDNIPSKSCGGNVAICNDVIEWAIKNNALYGIEQAFTTLAKAMAKKAMSGVLKRLFLFTKDLPIGKPDTTKPIPKSDDDVRQIVICDSVIRIIDKILHENIPQNVKDTVLGPYQVICKPDAAETATEALNRSLIILSNIKNLSGLSLDASNAFGCICRNKLYE